MSITEQIESALNTMTHNFVSSGGPISGLKRLSGGASQEIWAFEVRTPNGPPERFILRRAPGGKTPDVNGHAIPLTTEAQIIRAAAEGGVPVPHVAHICSEADGLGVAFIMNFIDGETLGAKIVRDERYGAARSHLARQCGAALAAIHKVSPDVIGSLTRSGAKEQLEQYEAIYRGFQMPRPVFELAFQELKRNLPAPMTPVLVHGDFRLGNLMIDEDGLRAVLDWELAHIGDPREDIAWICVNSWRFGQSQNRVGGVGKLEGLLAAYAAAGGARIDIEEISWWEMLGTLKWGIMCMIMYDSYANGTEQSVERAAIGRRVSETEIDLINLFQDRMQYA